MAKSAAEDIDSQDNDSFIQNRGRDTEQSDKPGLLHPSEPLKESKDNETEVIEQSKGYDTTEQSEGKECIELSNRSCILYYGIVVRIFV
jgi:hypothetical protein